MANGIADHNISVVRFNFAYMQLAQELNKRRPPEKANKLMENYLDVLKQVSDESPLFIGGKSMGGRIASMILDESSAKGCICMGYPFHPQKQPEKLRTEHLMTIQKPILMLQGERDALGTLEEVKSYQLPKKIQTHYLRVVKICPNITPFKIHGFDTSAIFYMLWFRFT